MYLGGGLVKMCEGKFEVEDSELWVGGRVGGWKIERGELENCLSFYMILPIWVEVKSPLVSS